MTDAVPGPPGRLPSADPDHRGSLTVDPVVTRKIVEYAADQVPGTLRQGRRLAGIEVGETGARARVTLGNGDPTAVDVRIELTVQYPSVVRTVVEAVRDRVGEELTFSTGQHLRSFAVTVTGLRTPVTAVTRLL